MKLVHIRYKDGRDKMIEMDAATEFCLSLPYTTSVTIPHFPPINPNTSITSMPINETHYELVPVSHLQVVTGIRGVRHYINIEEI